MSVLDNLRRIAKAMPDEFMLWLFVIGEAPVAEFRGFEFGNFHEWACFAECLGGDEWAIREDFMVKFCDEFGLYDFSAYSGPLAERMLRHWRTRWRGLGNA